MKTKLIRNLTALVAIAFLSSSCIQVDNVENAWKDSKADAALLGIWEDNDGNQCAFVKTEKGYHVTTGPNGLEGACKSFDAGGSTYIIVADLAPALLGFDKQKPDNKGGTLLRYEVKGGKLIMYSLDGEIVKKAIEAKEVAGTVEDDSASISEIDKATIAWFGKIAKKNDGWKSTTYNKVR